MSEQDNPLLAGQGPPRFDRIRAEHVVPAMESLLSDLIRQFEELETGLDDGRVTPSWESVVEPLERIGDRLQRAWGTVGHLMGVKNSDELRAAYEAAQPDVVTFSLRLGQSAPIFRALQALREGDGFAEFDDAQRRVVESLLRDARHAGVGLEGAERERFNEIQLELAELATSFSNHVLDATKAFGLVLRDAGEVDGLPESLLQLAAQSARESGESGATAEKGPWRITLEFPSFGPFMEHGRRRDLRERLYRAYVTRASEGDLDNAPLIRRILALRLEEARLLGFEDFAALSLDAKMAPDVDAVTRLLEELRAASWDAAVGDLDDLRALAGAEGAPEAQDLRQWDVAFWAERLREKRFDYSDEELRAYFPMPRVLEGLFALAQRLFGVAIEAADGAAPVWHRDVRFFRVRDGEGRELASFYLDPYSRPGEKRSGAWMDECLGRSRLLGPGPGQARLPVAYLVCNSTPPVGDRPSTMTFDEVTTLFHEFGHGLQHMLTRVDYGLAAGIRNIEWDAVELPSQFMENWCYQPETLREISAHVETGEPIPDDLVAKLRAARTYRAGSDMLRQIYFALTDLELHHGYDPEGDTSPFELQRKVAEKTTVLAPLPEDRFLCSFGHIFAGGYAAGYYSYKWAEVLSADAFAAFEEAGLDDVAAVAEAGRRFGETVLGLGGSRPPMEVFRAFRGREPSTRPLLRHAGLERAA